MSRYHTNISNTPPLHRSELLFVGQHVQSALPLGRYFHMATQGALPASLWSIVFTLVNIPFPSTRASPHVPLYVLAPGLSSAHATQLHQGHTQDLPMRIWSVAESLSRKDVGKEFSIK